VCLVGAGVARVGLSAVSRSSGKVRVMGGGGPVREGGVRNQQVEGDPFRASVWALEERKVGLDGEVEWRR
jgi:hypothetical protein